MRNDPDHDRRHRCPPEPPLSVAELLERVAAERGIDAEPAPAAVAAALPEMVALVERIVLRLHDAQEWRWLAAALAALSHRVQEDALLLGLDYAGPNCDGRA
ncbi:MAG TPA: hypothetical protein VM367_18700 [Pseudonocardia sp.]|nr:hypothetical protein [Pseudonocardia sp.]